MNNDTDVQVTTFDTPLNVVTTYTPGTTYTVVVTASAGDKSTSVTRVLTTDPVAPTLGELKVSGNNLTTIITTQNGFDTIHSCTVNDIPVLQLPIFGTLFNVVTTYTPCTTYTVVVTATAGGKSISVTQVLTTTDNYQDEDDKDEDEDDKDEYDKDEYDEDEDEDEDEDDQDEYDKDITRELGRIWREEMTDDQKATYSNLAEQEKIIYLEKMSTYEPSEEWKIIAAQQEVDKGKCKGVKKDPLAPKHPLSSYMLFCKDTRQRVKDDNPDFDAKDVLRELGRRWREDMTDEQKTYYIDLATDDKKRYEDEKDKDTQIQANPVPLPSGWEAVWDSDSSNFFYHEIATGIKQWEVPIDESKRNWTEKMYENLYMESYDDVEKSFRLDPTYRTIQEKERELRIQLTIERILDIRNIFNEKTEYWQKKRERQKKYGIYYKEDDDYKEDYDYKEDEDDYHRYERWRHEDESIGELTCNIKCAKLSDIYTYYDSRHMHLNSEISNKVDKFLYKEIWRLRNIEIDRKMKEGGISENEKTRKKRVRKIAEKLERERETAIEEGIVRYREKERWERKIYRKIVKEERKMDKDKKKSPFKLMDELEKIDDLD